MGRPGHELYLRGTYRLPNAQTSISLVIQCVSGFFDLDFKAPGSGEDRVKLDDHLLVDLAFRHEFNDLVVLTGAITKLTDEEYQEFEGYATQGRMAFLGLTATF